jgi:hypothetical protein
LDSIANDFLSPLKPPLNNPDNAQHHTGEPEYNHRDTDAQPEDTGGKQDSENQAYESSYFEHYTLG